MKWIWSQIIEGSCFSSMQGSWRLLKSWTLASPATVHPRRLLVSDSCLRRVSRHKYNRILPSSITTRHACGSVASSIRPHDWESSSYRLQSPVHSSRQKPIRCGPSTEMIGDVTNCAPFLSPFGTVQRSFTILSNGAPLHLSNGLVCSSVSSERLEYKHSSEVHLLQSYWGTTHFLSTLDIGLRVPQASQLTVPWFFILNYWLCSPSRL